MEVVKKTILQAVTTGITACTGTTGDCYVIIPDLTAVYYFKVGLTAEVPDFGFFDVYQYPYGYGTDYGENVFGIGEDLLLDDSYI